MSNLSLASPLNLYAPWLVPIAIAKESQPVLLTNSSAWAGSVYIASSAATFTSSSIPANFPSSASTTTPFMCAYSTTFFVNATFSSKSYFDPSIITDVNPLSIHILHVS